MESVTQSSFPPQEQNAEFASVNEQVDDLVIEEDIWPALLSSTETLWSERNFIARWTLRGTLLALTIALLLPNQYQSSVVLMPPDDQGNLFSLVGGGMDMGDSTSGGSGGSAAAGLGGLASSLLGMKSPGALYIAVAGSRTVQDGIIARFDLLKIYNDRYWMDARKHLSKNTEILEDKKSGIISITVTDTDRGRAQKIAQSYAEGLNSTLATLATSAARRERVFLEGRLKEAKQELDSSAQAFSQFASKNTAVDIKEQVTAMVDAAAQLQGQIIATRSELQGLQQIYTPDNYRVRTMQAQISELQRSLQKIGGSGKPVPESEKQLYPSIRQLPLLGVEWADLYRRSRIAETVYLLLTREYEVARIQEAKEIPTIKVLDSAEFPEKKSSPHRALITLASLLAALLASSVWVLWNSDLSKLIRSLYSDIFRSTFLTCCLCSSSVPLV